jgi:hypothetical protein
MGRRHSYAFSTVLLVITVPAFADITFTAGGTSTGGFAVSASADFFIDGSGNLDIVMKNLTTATTIKDVTGVLDGLNFRLTGGTQTLNFSGMTATATAFIDCADGPCTTVGTFDNDQNSGGTPGSPYTWGKAGGGIAAGSGAYHPAGIVDGLPTNADGSVNGNGPHNDLLEGPVTFVIPFNSGGTQPTGVSNVQFLFGTGPVCSVDGSKDCYNGTPSIGTLQTPPVPEPTIVALLGGVLLLTVRALRRYKHV